MLLLCTLTHWRALQQALKLHLEVPASRIVCICTCAGLVLLFLLFPHPQHAVAAVLTCVLNLWC